MISSVFIRWLLLLSISANRTWTLSTYIGQIASLKEQFLDCDASYSLMLGLNKHNLTSSSWFLLLLASVRILSLFVIRFLAVHQFFWLVSQTTSRGGRSGTRGRGQLLNAPIAINLATLAIVAIVTWKTSRTAHMAQSSDSLLPQPPSSSASQTSQASIASVAQPGNASACLTHTSSLGPWILDSGASDHLSGNKDLFSSITLPLIYLLKITRTLNCSITFSDKFVTLQDRSTGKTIGIGRESQGLYHLTSDSSPAVCISTDAPLLIHNRLGHPSLSKFQKMVPRFSTLSSLPCESCQLGKHTRVSFPKRLNNRAKSPFELVHTDVWGPCRTASTLGFQYFVTFIDDYSRCTWLFLMKNRAELFSIFQKFYTEIQTQFNISIRVLRSDNAREYFSAQFTSFMSHHGILHQSSCAHTPQQNGVAERKNRHLVETARTLLLHSHVPFRFWGTLFLPLDKLSAKAMKCLFLGYSRLQKVLPIPIVSPPEAMPPRPLQVYHRRPRVVAPLPFPEAPADSLPIPSASPAPALPSPNDLPIAVRKGTRSTRNPHPIYNFLSYHRLSSPYSALFLLYPLSLPKSTHEALSHPGWRQAMVDEMAALHSNGTWDLVVLPPGKSTVGCRWVYAVKIASVRLLLSMAAMCSWPLYQLDIKNAFLHGDLAEEVYMEQPPGFVAQGESGLVCRLRRSLYGLKQSPRAWFSRFSSVVQEFGMLRSTADHSVFYHHNSLGQCIYLVVYVDDIVITGSDQDGIQKLKQHLFTHFQTKDLGKLKYFLGIEIAQSSSGVVLSQRKYALDILEETGMLDCKPVDTPMDPNVKLVPGQGEPLGDPGRYRRLVGKLNYLTITRPDISFPCQGVLYENRGHTQVVGYTDADWAGSPTDRRSTSGYCVFIGGNLISWKSKKQDVVARSSAEAEYRAMALATCELIWLRHLLQELRFGKDEQMKLICDNQAALHIASNPVFHERTKHIEVDCHFIREKIASGCVATSFVNSNDQLADIFTKSLRGPRIKYICNKLGAYDVYAPA
ncbi:Retrovirus-related Pol polyprotein from transposon TNT 1-94 [Vitis vinifera]|uniref:Retrovirus-related Pol polyprotein from transposon TNT 1-94 n=1 Tax=Vitis vinifera TaxID=29760 RepID=A0A438BW13_VITVI|nr:Retrovirus-related Pol polyprotein from transposon TNT 1-94 [Vitis vinifera]